MGWGREGGREGRGGVGGVGREGTALSTQNCDTTLNY